MFSSLSRADEWTMSQILFYQILYRSYIQRNTNNIYHIFVSWFNLWAWKERGEAATQLHSSFLHVHLHYGSFSVFYTQTFSVVLNNVFIIRILFTHQRPFYLPVYTLLHSQESPLFFNKSISHVFKRFLSYLEVSWGNHIFCISGKVSNLLQLVRNFSCNTASYRKKFC